MEEAHWRQASPGKYRVLHILSADLNGDIDGDCGHKVIASDQTRALMANAEANTIICVECFLKEGP